MKVDIKILDGRIGKEWKLPEYKTNGSVGMDLVAAIKEPVIIKSGERKLVPVGFSMSLQLGYEAQIRPRSGLAINNGITVLNSPGTIDGDYRDQIGVILVNLSDRSFTVDPGNRIAQMIINKVEIVEWNVVDELDKTDRKGGFGSTGF